MSKHIQAPHMQINPIPNKLSTYLVSPAKHYKQG